MKRYQKFMKLRRVMALFGIAAIVLLYIWLFILAVRGDENTQTALFTAFAATIIVPVLIYALGLIAKNMILYGQDELENDEENNDENKEGKSGTE